MRDNKAVPNVVVTLAYIIAWVGVTYPLYDYWPGWLAFVITVSIGILGGWFLGGVWK